MSTTNGLNSTAPLVYTPALPLQPSWTSVMSQDIITTDAIPVDSTSVTPVATFTNPLSLESEALVVANLSKGNESFKQICHVARNRASEAGWNLIPLFGGRIAKEVAGGTAYAGSSDASSIGFFNDDNGVYSTQLQPDATWSDPQTVLQSSASNLKVAYSPAGRVVLYGNTPQGDLLMAYQPQIGGPFATTVCAMQGGLVQGDFYLCMTDEKVWTLTANVSGQPSVYSGLIDSETYSSVDQVSDFQGTLKQVVLGYWNNSQNTVMFLLVDTDNALHVWAASTANATTVIQPIPNSTVTAATGHVSTDQTLHVYSIDNEMNLWVLHQDKDDPWNDDGTPNWSPFIPLDKQVAFVASDTNPADSPSLFVCSADNYALRLHAQDPLTGMWRSGHVLQDSEEAFEVVRFRTEVTLFDANGVALSNYPVTISAAEGFSATEVCVAGSNHAVDSQTNVSLTTDYTGKLTMAILTNTGMAAPNLVLNAEGLNSPMTVQPAGPIHNYLAGQGPLNLTNPGGPLPVFDKSGSTLTAAKVNGSPLAPGAQGNSALAAVAASAIQNTAQVANGQSPPDVAGYSFTISGPDGPTFKVHSTKAEVDAELARLMTSSGRKFGNIWDDVEQWAGDVWEGIKNGLIKVQGALVNVANQVASFTARIGDMIVDDVKLAIKGVEQAAHFIVGVFQAVEAELAKVIDWLKAAFDFGAIWRTKKVFEDGLLRIPAYIKLLLEAAQGGADNWFSEKEAEVNTAFDKLKASLAGKSFNDLPNFPQPGQPPNNQTKIAGNATPADFNNNVHHNWLQDKVSSNAPPDFGLSPEADFVNTWTSAGPKLMSSANDFLAALTDFKNAIASTIENPKSFGSVAVPDFLDAIKHLFTSMLKLCDAILDLMLGLAKLAMDAAETLLNTPLQLGYLNTLWKWIAEQAGDSSDDELTLSAVIALIAAFPATVTYKLIEGVSSEPFPDGKPPWQTSAGMLSTALGAMPKSCLQVAAVLQIGYAVPWMVCDYMGPAAPAQMSALTIGLGGLIWVLNNGFPDVTLVVTGVLLLEPVATLVAIVGFETVLNAIKALTANADALIMLFALYGLARIGFLAVTGVTDEEKALVQILLALPFITDVLNLSPFRADPFAPAFLAAVLIFDAVGFMGGGTIELIEASASSAQAATAESGR